MHVATNFSELTRAEAILREALATEQQNRNIRHSLAELDLKRSRLATDPLERQAWRGSAIEQASALTASSPSSYPYHTLLKAAVDEVKDSLATVERTQDETSVLQLGNSIARAEDVLRKGLQRFPSDPLLLGQEGELSTILAQADRAARAFQKAFDANPRSTLLARRLSRIQRAKGAFSDALKTLRLAIEANPSSRKIHYDIALTILESAPNADQLNSDDVLYHLRRAFAPGDRSYHVQFWYARQLCVANRYEEARPLFAALKEARVPFREKEKVEGVISDELGKSRRFTGTISNLRSGYGFIQCDNPQLGAFVAGNELGDLNPNDLFEGAPVSFELGFTLREPIAQNVELVGS